MFSLLSNRHTHTPALAIRAQNLFFPKSRRRSNEIGRLDRELRKGFRIRSKGRLSSDLYGIIKARSGQGRAFYYFTSSTTRTRRNPPFASVPSKSKPCKRQSWRRAGPSPETWEILTDERYHHRFMMGGPCSVSRFSIRAIAGLAYLSHPVRNVSSPEGFHILRVCNKPCSS